MAESQQSADDGVKSKNLNPPIIMKIDAPVDESNKQESEDNDNNESAVNTESFKVCSPSYRPPVSSSNLFSLTQSKLTKGILKPPQLSLNNSPAKSTFTLNPSRLNPFSTSEQKSDISDKKNHVNGETSKETPIFVPLVQTESKTNIATPSKPSKAETASNTSFVFGQNLQERVIAAENKVDEPAPSTSISSNGSAELLFSSVIKNEVKTDNNSTKEAKSLSESAREYEESRANKRKYDEVEVKTGEEEETNIISVSCKLFSYDKAAGNYQERGRGTLRLNDLEIDDNQTQSRLVFRTSGSLRVILNTKIWAEMTVERASEKSIRLTALDSNGEIKVFLIMANIEDSKQLFNQLHSRLQKEISAQKRRKSDNTENNSGPQ